MPSLFGLPLGYWTFKLVEHGFQWCAVVTGVPAAFLLLALFSLLVLPTEETGDGEQGSEPPQPDEPSSPDAAGTQ